MTPRNRLEWALVLLEARGGKTHHGTVRAAILGEIRRRLLDADVEVLKGLVVGLLNDLPADETEPAPPPLEIQWIEGFLRDVEAEDAREPK